MIDLQREESKAASNQFLLPYVYCRFQVLLMTCFLIFFMNHDYLLPLLSFLSRTNVSYSLWDG
jgi:hypothetical protein